MTGADRRGTRAERMAMPLARNVVKDLATEHGACQRPVQLRRTEIDTGYVEQVLIPCGHTLASVCPPCAERARILRATQCREGWHLDHEPVIDPDPATGEQSALVTDRAEVQADRDALAKEGLDTTDLLRRHIAPHFEAKTVAEVKEAHIRRWRRQLLDSEVSAVTTAKTYRLIKAILNTAVDDGIIRRNPCRIKGAGLEKSPERPVLTIPEVFALAEVIDPRYGALVLLGTFGSLRWGELAALRRKDIDLAVCTIRVERQLTEMPGGGYAYGAPKSDASVRTVSIPNLVVPRIRWHLAQFTKQDPEAPVFTAPTGTPLRHGNFRRRFWLPALKAAGLPTIHFHDLRHTGNTLTADAGANLRELMERMGHSTTRAALVYLHSTSERQRAIADAVDKAARATLRKTKTPKNGQSASGTKVARRRDQAS